MAKKERPSITIRMGATNYDLNVVTSKREVINYDLSTMNCRERRALQASVVAAFRKHQSDVLKVINHK